MKVTFKNQKRETGLAAICEGTPSIDIKVDGEEIGVINFNDSSSAINWHLDKNGINVGFNFIATERELKRNPNAKWNFHYVGRTVNGKFERAKFESGDAAKAWVKANIDRFLPRLYVEKKEIAA